MGTLLALCLLGVWHVDDDAPGDPGAHTPLIGDPLEDGSAAHPFDAIAEALAIARDGDLILVSDGVYQGLGNRELDFAGKDLVLQGPGSPLRAVVNAQAAGRAFTFHSGETPAARVEGLVIANGSGTQGGGISITGGSHPTLVRCLITGNHADEGAGLSVDGGGVALQDCIISRNAATGRGGGLGVAGAAAVTLTGCTFVSNSAGSGGALHARGVALVDLANAILWSGVAPVGPEIHLDEAASLHVDHCDVQGGSSATSVNGGALLDWGAGNIDADPVFEDPPFSDWHLHSASPCIDAGDPAFVPGPGASDVDTEPRVVGLAVDMGADEIECEPLTGLDCNANGMPDACEHDCNGNGLPDPCDIDSGFSKDVNGDDVPDECAPWLTSVVDDDAPADPGPGTPSLSDPLEEGSPQHPFDALQEAIDAAMSFSFVVPRQGSYRGTGNRDVDFHGKNEIVAGQLGPAGVIFDAEGAGRHFHFQGGELRRSHLKGLTLVNGSAVRGGSILTEQASSPQIVECVFQGNAAQWGGAVAFEGGDETLRNCIVAGNTAAVAGGGVWIADAADSFVRACTVVGNSAGVRGGGIAVEDTDGTKLRGSIVWENDAPAGEQLALALSGALAVTWSDVQGGQAAASATGGSTLSWGSQNIDADPQLVALGDDHHITVGSPCIDAGFPTYTPQPGETDIDRDPRILGESMDIGADEIVCQQDLGYAGPGSVELLICGADLTQAGSAATLRLEGAAASAPVFLFVGLVSDPTSLKGGTLVPYPWLLLLDDFLTDVTGALEVGVPGGLGPFTVYLQAVVPDGPVLEFSNALQLVE